MFGDFRSDSMALSHVWLGLPGGRFRSDGGLLIAAADCTGDSLHQEHCVRCGQHAKMSIAVDNLGDI